MRRMLLTTCILLLVAASSVAVAQKVRYGDWQVDLSSSTGTEAFTVNESGSIFGFVCFVSIDRCTYYISAHTTCDKGSKSTVLLNLDSGAATSTITCTEIDGTYYNALESSTDLATAIAASTTMGIAIPMQSGQFKVVRFSLNGANQATGAAARQATSLERNADHLQ